MRSVTLDVDGTAYGCCGLLIREHIVGRFPTDSLADIVTWAMSSPVRIRRTTTFATMVPRMTETPDSVVSWTTWRGSGPKASDLSSAGSFA